MHAKLIKRVDHTGSSYHTSIMECLEMKTPTVYLVIFLSLWIPVRIQCTGLYLTLLSCLKQNVTEAYMVDHSFNILVKR